MPDFPPEDSYACNAGAGWAAGYDGGYSGGYGSGYGGQGYGYGPGSGLGTTLGAGYTKGRPVAGRPTIPTVAGYAYDPNTALSLSTRSDEVLATQGPGIYDRMDADDQVAASMALLVLAVTGGELAIEPAVTAEPGERLGDDTPPARRRDIEAAALYADEFRRSVNGVPNFLDEVEALYFEGASRGCALAEPEWTTKDGLVLLGGLRARPPWSWAWLVDNFGREVGVLAQTAGGQVWYPRSNYLIYSNAPRRGDPRGTSDKRAAYEPWLLKITARPERAKWIKQFADPSLVVTYDAAAPAYQMTGPDGQIESLTPQQQADYIGRNFQGGSHLSLPKGWEAVLIESKSDGGGFRDNEESLNKAIARAILMTGTATNEADRNSVAQAGQSDNVFQAKVARRQRALDNAIRRDLACEQTVRNHGESERWLAPHIRFKPPGHLMPELWTAFAALVNGKAVPPSIAPKLYPMLGLPVPNPDDFDDGKWQGWGPKEAPPGTPAVGGGDVPGTPPTDEPGATADDVADADAEGKGTEDAADDTAAFARVAAKAPAKSKAAPSGGTPAGGRKGGQFAPGGGRVGASAKESSAIKTGRAADHLKALAADVAAGKHDTASAHKHVDRIARGTVKAELFDAAHAAGIKHAAKTKKDLIAHLKATHAPGAKPAGAAPAPAPKAVATAPVAKPTPKPAAPAHAPAAKKADAPVSAADAQKAAIEKAKAAVVAHEAKKAANKAARDAARAEAKAAKAAGAKPAPAAKAKPAGAAEPVTKPKSVKEAVSAAKSKAAAENPPTPPTTPKVAGWTPRKSSEFADHSLDAANGDKAVSKQFDGWAKSLHPAEAKAIRDYTKDGGTYADVNKQLRGLNSGATPAKRAKVEKEIKLIDAALGKGSLHEDTTLFRGVDPTAMMHLGISDPSKLKPGQPIEMKGFQSTTLDYSQSHTFAHCGAVLKIHAPKGTKGGYLNAGGLSKIPDEREFLLHPSANKFRVVSVKAIPKIHPGSPGHEITLEIDHG